jgi:heme exporter protein A
MLLSSAVRWAVMRLYGENLSLERGGRRLFAGLFFEVREGEVLVIQGSNGTGKTSLLRAIAGFLPFSGGRLRHEGGDAHARLGEQAHYLGHANSLRDALTAEENLAFWAAMQGGAAFGVKPALARLGLPHVLDFPVGALSTGQKRRVALARLLVAHREIWLLDEPTTALDIASQILFANTMQEHLSKGGLILVATHVPLGIVARREVQLDSAGWVPVGVAT